MKICKIILLILLLLLNTLSAKTTQNSINEIENNQQDFINEYLKEIQKQRVHRGETSATIEVSYEATNRKKYYKRGQRLRDTTQELEDIKLDNKRLRIEAERLGLENQILQESQKKYSKKKYSKKKVKTKKHKTKKYKRSTKYKSSKPKTTKRRVRSKIVIKVDTVLKKMRIYRGSKLIYNWSIIMRESSTEHSEYKKTQSYRSTNHTQSYLRAQKKKPIYFNNVRDSKERKPNTLYSKIKLRQKHINILNKLMKQYGKKNVIIKMIR